METKLECSNGFVEIERIIDEDNKEGVKLTTNIDDEGTLGLTLTYDCKSKADASYQNLSKENPDKLQAGILQMLGL